MWSAYNVHLKKGTVKYPMRIAQIVNEDRRLELAKQMARKHGLPLANVLVILAGIASGTYSTAHPHAAELQQRQQHRTSHLDVKPIKRARHYIPKTPPENITPS